MAQRVATKTAYYNADKSKLVEEGDPDAAFLFVRAGSAIRYPEEADRLGYTAFEEVKEYDTLADHEAKHAHETAAQAAVARERMLEGQPDPDGAAVEGERDAKSVADAAETKAVSRAPQNKAK